ncbi:hypothetical protein MYVALT_F_01250 [Candidatus Vallotia tarda]|uniref:Uncharacterized protein n=1 Tax=Candidatus Vallotiella hemipterorum TaxID=1177213 RepID=A0A916NLZ2_9BURK|nr:hypothetical protein MYVALT_F_01250 [Candidatus Vallotia tarda]
MAISTIVPTGLNTKAYYSSAYRLSHVLIKNTKPDEHFLGKNCYNCRDTREIICAMPNAILSDA